MRRSTIVLHARVVRRVVAELQAQLEGGGLPHPLQLVVEPRPGGREQGGQPAAEKASRRSRDAGAA